MVDSAVELPAVAITEGQGAYKFIQRLGRMPLVDQAIVTGRASYQRVKGATPSLIQPAIQSVEDTTLTVIGHLISKIQALPLPLAYADEIACSGLDKLEEWQERKTQIIKRLQTLESEEKLLTTGDTDFYQRLVFMIPLCFLSETQKIVLGEVAGDVVSSFFQTFIATQIRILEKVEVVVDSVYRAQKLRISNKSETANNMNEVKFKTDMAVQIQYLKQIFDDAMQQRNIMRWVRASPNPFEPVWKHLHASAQSLTPDEATIENFSAKVYFSKVILRSTIEQIKLATQNPMSTVEELRTNVVDNLVSLARAWLPEFALNGIIRMTEYVLSYASDVQAPPRALQKPRPPSRPQTLKSPTRESIGIPTIPEEDENVESDCTTPESSASSERLDTDEEPEPTQNSERTIAVEGPISDDQVCMAEIAEEAVAEESFDRRNGLANTTQPEATNEADSRKLLRMTRRRKNSKSKHYG